MDKEKIERIQTKVDSLRLQAANLKTSDLVTLAKSLERTKRRGGKHLIYESPLLSRRAVSITGHPSKAIGKGLALKILNELEADIDAWIEELERDEKQKGQRKG